MWQEWSTSSLSNFQLYINYYSVDWSLHLFAVDVAKTVDQKVLSTLCS